MKIRKAALALNNLSGREVIELLGMVPHPEGGAFVETFRDEAKAGARPHSSAIYYLLQAGEHSHWHRIDAAEVWHFYAGAPLELSIAAESEVARHVVLGAAIDKGERPQAIVPERAWQAARSLGAWTLVGCTVAPAFDFGAFELAPPEWRPD